LQQFCNDNQQLIEQANRDMKALETKELEIERLKRQAGKLQKENEQARIDLRKLPT
jgi:peptidoglycan hydrolase CwlO-like protein